MLLQDWIDGHEWFKLEQWTWLSFHIWVSFILDQTSIILRIWRIQNIIFSSTYAYTDGICNYSTASTSEATYIIGGYYTKDIIAEFKKDSWRRLGTLAKGRFNHESITLNDETMVIGGYTVG